MKILIDKSTVLAYYFNQGSWENNLDRIMEMVRLGFVDAYITELSLGTNLRRDTLWGRLFRLW
jgi:hypothetical protein